MDTLIKEKVNLWLSGNFDSGTKEQLTKLQNENPSEVADAFYRNLEFGTGGLRGIMGVGTNRMNKYTVGMATQGFANYLSKNFTNQEISVAIAHDSRNNSRQFAEIAANVRQKENSLRLICIIRGFVGCNSSGRGAGR